MKTLVIGAVTGLITSFFVKSSTYAEVLKPISLELLGVVLFHIGLGLVFSIISQTGFFAYMFINRYGHSFFRSYWPLVQILLVAFVLFDLVYFPYQATDISLYLLILMSVGIFLIAVFVAVLKVKGTNRSAFIPALFVMVVITSIEWVPGLRASVDYAWLMIIPLLACNAYQLLILHHLTKADSNKETKAKPSKA